MLRIHFTASDLASTTIAGAADPLWEVLLSGFRLRDSDLGPEFRPWYRQVRQRRVRLGPGAHLLPVLTPMGPYIPDFLTPTDASSDFDDGLEAIRRTPKARLRAELTRLAQCAPVPDWVRPLADGDVVFLNRLTDELRAFHAAAVSPCRDTIRRSIDADHMVRSRALVESGFAGLFAGLGPFVRWRPPVLEVDYRVDRDLHLNGRGLRLIPSFFSRKTADALADDSLAPVLVYPIDQQCRWAHASTTDGRRALAALLGPTRAAVLRAIDLGATSGQLVHRLKTSPASVSRHTGALRGAGLIATHRLGTGVLHRLTPLGAALLDPTQPMTGKPAIG